METNANRPALACVTGPGCLVECHDRWVVAHKGGNDRHGKAVAWFGDSVYLSADGQAWGCGNDYHRTPDRPMEGVTVLLPPRPSGPAEVLRCLAELPGAKEQTEQSICIDVEHARFYIYVTMDDRLELITHFSSGHDGETYPARGRDHQKEGAIREWLGGRDA
jgi:hypothetical protein